MLRLLALLVALWLGGGAGAEAQELRGTLKKVREGGAIALGFRENARPFSFAVPGGAPAGYSIDLCQRVVDEVRAQLGLSTLSARWLPVTPETRIPLVVNGTVDLECGSTTNTLGRQATVDFSTLTFVDGASLLTRIGSNISSVAHLANRRVAVIPNTTTERALAAALEKSWISTAQIVPVREHAEGLAAVVEGRAEAFASDRAVLVGLLRQARDPGQLRVSNQYFSYEPYALMLRRDDPDFRLAVNRALARVYQSVLISQIYEKWFGRFSQASTLVQSLYTLGSLPD